MTIKKFLTCGTIAAVCFLLIAFIAMGAQAQAPTPPQTQAQAPASESAQTPEKPKEPVITPNPIMTQDHSKAWEIQAKSIAEELALTPELTAKLVDTYKAARKSCTASVLERMKQTGGFQEKMAAINELVTGERKKLEDAFKTFLTPEQTAKALETLGIFNSKWDVMVETIDGFNMEPGPRKQAMQIVTTYAIESSKLIQPELLKADSKKVFAEAKTLREKLDADLSKILTPQDSAKWMATASKPRIVQNSTKESQQQQTPAPPQEEKK
jgi:hypothetical protein